MNNTKLWIAMIVVSIIAVLSLIVAYNAYQSATFGSTGTRFPNGVSADSTSPIAGELRGTSFKLTSTATTSLSLLSSAATKGFCVTLNATSTNTISNLTFQASTTASVTNTFPAGIVPVINYGACN